MQLENSIVSVDTSNFAIYYGKCGFRVHCSTRSILIFCQFLNLYIVLLNLHLFNRVYFYPPLIKGQNA